MKNQQWRLQQHPEGVAMTENFQWHEEFVKPLQEGEILVKNTLLSIDPTNRVWMKKKDTYLPALKPTEVMRGLAIGEVVDSQCEGYKPGDLVQGLFGFQKYYAGSTEGISILPNLDIPLEAHFCLLGHIGLAAYYGTMNIGDPKPGETVVISAAAGAVGSIAAQIAKLQGCHVVGIAGSDDKCKWLLDELGLDEAINYKTEDLEARLKESCPKGIDVYFDNVGGKTLDIVIGLSNNFGRIVACGMIDDYNNNEPKFESQNILDVVTKRLSITGFVCLDQMEHVEEAYNFLYDSYQQGKIKYRQHVVDGLENAIDAINKLFDGTNQGKLMVKV